MFLSSARADSRGAAICWSRRSRAIRITGRRSPGRRSAVFGCLHDGWTEDPEADRRKGIDFARRALEVAGDDPGILANAALALAYFGEDIGAMMALVDRALALNPSFARGWYISGVLRLWAGQPDLAIEHVETSLRLSPRARVGTSLAVIGIAYFFSRRFDEAVPKLLLAIQDDPSYPAPVSLSRRLLCPYGPARRSARDRRAAARHHPCRDTGRQLPAEPRAPRAVSVGPAPGDGRVGRSLPCRHRKLCPPALCAQRSRDLVDRHLVGDAAQAPRACSVGFSPLVSSRAEACAFSTTCSVTTIEREAARPWTRDAILTVWPK